MLKSICLNFLEIKYEGDSIGRDIRVEIEIFGSLLKINKRISSGEIRKINQKIGCFEINGKAIETNISIAVVEKDLLFSDTGNMRGIIKIDASKSFPQKFEYSVLVMERRRVFWKKTAVFKIMIEAEPTNEPSDRKPKLYKSPNPKHDYNRFDEEIRAAVERWNKEFAKQDNPPPTPLDPNLVKAMVYIESVMGYGSYIAYPSYPDIMQVGNPKDKAMHIFYDDGEEPTEYEVIGGKLERLYIPEANAKTPAESVIWGTRWLYHKAQKNINEGENWTRNWISWLEAAKRYNGRKSYLEDIKKVYQDGVDPHSGRKLWIITGLLLILFGSTFFISDSGQEFFYRNETSDQTAESRRAAREESISRIINNSRETGKFKLQKTILGFYNAEELSDMEAIQVEFYDRSIFAVIVEWEKDWWEELRVGKTENGKVTWLDARNLPTEQSIFSARFITLSGITNPVLEVYGETHAGHGSFYVYEVKDNKLGLLLETVAVDINDDIRWAPDNNKKYGYENCGERYEGGKLHNEYRDINGDKMADIILSGTEEKICEEAKNWNSSPLEFFEVKAAKAKVEKIFLWSGVEKKFMTPARKPL